MSTPVVAREVDLLPIVGKLKQDISKAAATLGPREARHLVDQYYMMQKQRMRTANQARAMSSSKEPHSTLEWLEDQSSALEAACKRMLKQFAESRDIGVWSLERIGIGPVIAAGLIAHIDISRAPTVGHIWSFAGLNPTVRWEKKQKRPWNATLKTLCWKIGESFVKVSGNPKSLYGAVYRERKVLEEDRNARGEFAEAAADQLRRFNYGKTTEAYKAYIQGILPPAHIHARAKRYAVKLFLSHWHHRAYEYEYGKAPPMPYILTQPPHSRYIEAPRLGDVA